MELVGFSFFVISGWDLDLDYCNGKWLSLERSQDRSVILRLHPSTTFWTVLLIISLLHFF